MRTLKYIRHPSIMIGDGDEDNDDTAVDIEDLKDAAREWIDKMNNGYCYCHEENHMNEWKDYNECVMGNNIVISWIKNFFNLEDEE